MVAVAAVKPGERAAGLGFERAVEIADGHCKVPELDLQRREERHCLKRWIRE